MRRTVLSMTLVLTVLFVAASPIYAQKERTIAETASPAGIRTIEIRADVGSIDISASARSDIRLSIRLKGKTSWKWFSSRTGDPDQLQLIQAKHGDILELSLSGSAENVDEQWVLEVPASLGARLTMDVGKIQASGLQGGCEARTSVGDIVIDVPKGDILAASDVGNIRLVTGTSSYGNVDIRTDVGHVDASIEGHRVELHRAPGSGDSFKLSGAGRDRIRARANVGAVEVRIR